MNTTIMPINPVAAELLLIRALKALKLPLPLFGDETRNAALEDWWNLSAAVESVYKAGMTLEAIADVVHEYIPEDMSGEIIFLAFCNLLDNDVLRPEDAISDSLMSLPAMRATASTCDD